MDRSRSLDRRYRRILYGGLLVSAGVHAALVGISFDVPLPAADRDMEIERIVTQPFEAVEIVAVAAPSWLPAGDLAAADAGPASPAAPSRSAAASRSASAPPVPAPVVAEVTYEQLTVFDPLSSAPIRPVEFEHLPDALANLPVDSDMAGEAEDEVALYVPGSIGAAKRQWSGATGASTVGGGGGGIRIFGGGGSGGHCPMPGGRVVPPVWR